jgi:transcriptional regulator with XRE-family HTH domain
VARTARYHESSGRVTDSTPTPAQVGNVIRRLRESRSQMSQEDLADVAGISANYLSGIELGQRNPTLAVLSALASGLEVPLSRLIADAEGE